MLPSYQGGGEMAIVATKLIRAFPIYKVLGENWVKTEKVRQLQCSLKQGDALCQFMLDKLAAY